MKEINVFCVLKAGKKYGPDHVERLKAAVERNTTRPINFICLSDVPVKCDRIPLRHQWPGFWSKIELFRKDVAKPDALNVYIDLDVLVTGNLDEFLDYNHNFSMTRDDNYPARANSSVMAWTGDHSSIYESMKANPTLNRLKYIKTPWYGDQALIEKTLIDEGQPPDRLDDIFNGCSKTYRYLACVNELPAETLFVSFQGPIAKPGSDKLKNDPLIQRHWDIA